MIDHPDAAALMDLVATWLKDDNAPTAYDRRLARNALDVVAREIADAPAATDRARGSRTSLRSRA